MKKVFIIAVVLALAFSLSACSLLEDTAGVSQADYDALAKERDELKADYDAVVEERDNLQTLVEELQNQLSHVYEQSIPSHIKDLQNFISNYHHDLVPNKLPNIDWLPDNEYSVRITCTDYEVGNMTENPDELIRHCKELADLVVVDISAVFFVREFEIAFLSDGVPAGYAVMDYVEKTCQLMINGKRWNYTFN